jgi:hypothetical protein
LTSALVWAEFGVGPLSALCLWGIAAISLRGDSRGHANVHLAVMGIAGGFDFGLGSLAFVVADRTTAYNLFVYGFAVSWIYVPAYLCFLGVAIKSRLLRPLRSRWVRVAVYAIGAGSAVASVVWNHAVYVGFEHDPNLGWDATPGLLFLVSGWSSIALVLLTIPVTIFAWRSAAAGTIERQRAGAYLSAFLVADGSILVSNVAALLVTDVVAQDFVDNVLFPLGFVAFAALLVRGIVRYQLLDFDLKVKWTLQRGTVAAIILGAAVVAGQVAQNYLSGAFGWLAGGIVAGLLIFAIRPIERFAERLSDRAMPRTTGTPEYLAQRKHEIYRAAIEDAMRDGVVSAKERALLLRLSDNLGLSSDESTRIEREVLGASA